jgi:hypothetical protein
MKSVRLGSALWLVLLVQNSLGAAQGFVSPAVMEITDDHEVAPEFADRVSYAATTDEPAAPVPEPDGPGCENACGNCGCNTCRGCCRSPLFSSPGCRQPIFSPSKFLHVFRASDHAFDSFISPQTNVLLFEDPRTLSEVRAHFVNQNLPTIPGLFPAGGNAQFAAAQVRAAITDRLSFIAVQDGYLWINGKGQPGRSGLADWAAGFKYNIVRNPDRQFVWSAAATFYIATNEPQVFQYQTNQFHFFTTAGTKLEFLPFNSHILAGGGYRVPTNGAFTQMMWASSQFDIEVIKHIYGTFSCNWFHYLNNGTNLPVSFEGADLFNLGSSRVAGTNVATLGVGTRYKPNCHREYGVAYEFPVTTQQGVMSNRIYVDAIFRF